MTTFTTKITSVKTKTVGNLTDVVAFVEWQLSGTDGPSTFELVGRTTMAEADPNAFTPFENLSEADVRGWVEAAEEENQFPGMRAHIQMVLDRMNVSASLESKPMPWAPAPEAPQSPSA